MKIGRNDPCPCGSGKKYKKCCLNKPKENIIVDNDEIHALKDIFSYHDNYVHTNEVKAPQLNKKLLNIYDNRESLSIKTVIDYYLEIMNYILDYADENNIHTIEEIDEESIVSDFLINIIGDFEGEILNLDKDDYDLSVTNNYLDRLVKIIELDDDNIYENSLRCKTNSLFKLGNYKLGEQVMLDLISEKRNSIYAYVELVDDFEMVGNLKKAKYYYDLGLKQKNLSDLDALEERKNYFKNM